ncbi:MAG: U32 family peptidase [Clostridium sp.]|nr:U32 family peptidase [Prevotella sp.]MCM1429246.1 U32 family peptidase [Clostridium sp.]
MKPREIELLAPAANAETALEAILHGADAVYIGGPSHGARKNAANTIDDIRKVVDFAHTYRAKVYTTVNTIIYESELKEVERLVTDLWRAEVDALIVQDMGLLRLDIPPIALHASTQCDIRTLEKAQFLANVGFSQLVLARELSLQEIAQIALSVDVPIETFVHGALCVSYSGRCHASQACFGRSANRGACAQVCRQPWRLSDASGRRVAPDAHFLSLKDFNATSLLGQLLEVGVSSFKIEGRLKDTDYVKNIVGHYRKEIDRIITESDGRYIRSSKGESILDFTPNPEKSFNRGFTHYFLEQQPGKPRPTGIWAPETPKSRGELIYDIRMLRSGDGISFFNKEGEYTGMVVNGVENGKIRSNRKTSIPRDSEIRRTYDKEWQKLMLRPTARRVLDLDITLDSHGVTVIDDRGVYVRLPLEIEVQKAEKAMDFRRPFEKLGNTPFRLREFHCNLPEDSFIPLSYLTALRRKLVESLQRVARATHPLCLRRGENRDAKYPENTLTYVDNVANSKAEALYRSHGVEKIEPAMECRKNGKARAGERVMTTRHCILRELGICLKDKGGKRGLKFPLKIQSGPISFDLKFDCNRCEMQLLSR